MLTTSLVVSGLYGLVVSGTAGSDYHLRLTAEAAVPCQEGCPALHYGQTISGQLAAGAAYTTLDWEGHAGDEVTFMVTGQDGAVWTGQLYGPDAGRVACPLLTDRSYTCHLPTDGRYLLFIFPADKQTDPAYTLSLEARRP